MRFMMGRRVRLLSIRLKSFVLYGGCFYFMYFCRHNEPNFVIMTQIILNIEDASLVPSLKQILSAIKGVTIDKLVTTKSDVEAEETFIKETITRGYQEAQEGRFAGKNLNSLDALVNELRADA